jgi:hypothetical protein
MNLLHSTWFWMLIILGPIGTVIGILSRLARRESPYPARTGQEETSADGAGNGLPPSESTEEKDKP